MIFITSFFAIGLAVPFFPISQLVFLFGGFGWKISCKNHETVVFISVAQLGEQLAPSNSIDTVIMAEISDNKKLSGSCCLSEHH